MRIQLILAMGLVAGLAACGSNPADRAITGAGIGAAAGAAGALVSDNDVGPGALVGGLAGAVIGGATSAEDFDLGDPIYRRRF